MDFQGIIGQIVNLLNTSTPGVAIVLFLICAIGEFGFAVPFILETFWILCGYELSSGEISPLSLGWLMLGAAAGRIAGSTFLYFLSRYGSLPLIRYYQKHFEKKIAKGNTISGRITAGLKSLSPFAIAMGRLMWLRIPLTLALGAQRRGKTLIVAVFLAALVWDAGYIILGATAGKAIVAQPISMVVYSISGLLILYVASYAIRRFRRYRITRRQEKLT